MKLRLATYNLNNLFRRPRVLELPGFSPKARDILDDVSQLDGLLRRPSYGGKVGARILEILDRYEIGESAPGATWFQIQEVRGRLFSLGKAGRKLVASGRDDWVGWVDLVSATVGGQAVENTARVLNEVAADVLCVVEVEDRTALDRFNRDLLGAGVYPHAMSLEGNDPRGIDVGILSRFPIRTMRSHVDDVVQDGSERPPRVFSRDCAQYELGLPDGTSLWFLCTHLKSKGYGDFAHNELIRARQARRIRDLVSRFDLTRDWVVVAGDLNDVPEGRSLRDLFETPHLHDVLDHMPSDSPRWTYRDGRSQIDYLLVSRPIFERVIATGIERRGIWRKGVESFAEVDSLVTQASDHAAVWADVASS